MTHNDQKIKEIIEKHSHDFEIDNEGTYLEVLDGEKALKEYGEYILQQAIESEIERLIERKNWLSGEGNKPIIDVIDDIISHYKEKLKKLSTKSTT